MMTFARVVSISVLAALMCGTTINRQSNAASEEDVDAAIAGNTQFALDLYERLRTEPGNLFFSPYSISTALAMTFAGARGATAVEMAKTLHLDLPPDRQHAAFNALIADLNAAGHEGSFQLSVANALWGQKGFAFLEDFLSLVHENYGGTLQEVDFEGDTEGARLTINRWVEHQTKDKIKDLIPPGVLGVFTRLVLTNAIYFKGAWLHQFEEKQTAEAPFHLSADKQVSVPMMHQTEDFPYAETDDLQIVRLPYRGSASMLILLPKRLDGLADLEKALSVENLQKWLGLLRRRAVDLWMPKFKTTCQFNLADVLKAMGMSLAFSKDLADFSGMTGNRDLFISHVIHKAFVDVNEQGTEAAAATAVGMLLTMAPQHKEPVVFRADRPFVFLILGGRSSSVLFVGRIANPLEKGAD